MLGYGMWHHLQTDPGYDSKFKMMVMTYIDIHSVSGVASFITIDEQLQ